MFFSFIFFPTHINAQKGNYKSIPSIESFVGSRFEHMYDSLKLLHFSESLQDHSKEHDCRKTMSKEEMHQYQKEHAKYLLMLRYYDKYPAEGQHSKSVPFESCENGGFENGTTGFSGQSAFEEPDGHSNDECNAVGTFTYVNDPLDSLNNPFENTFELVSAGLDTFVGINKVLSGNSAMRINGPTPGHGVNELTYEFETTRNRSAILYNYALVFENPSNHNNRQPFFHVEAFVNGASQGDLCREADQTDPNCSIVRPPNNDTVIVYSEWLCDYINISADSGDIITMKFTVGDCGFGGHWGYAYLDNICGVSGSIEMEEIIACPDVVCICGNLDPSFHCQEDSLVSLQLNIYQDSQIVNTIQDISAYDETDGSFCFDVDTSSFTGSSGGYDFEVISQFVNLFGDTLCFRDSNFIPGINNDYTYGEITPHPKCISVSCDTLFLEPLEATRCDTSDLTSAYMSNFRFQLPDSLSGQLDLCPNTNLVFVSEDAQITTIDYEIQRGAPDMPDFLRGEIKIIPDADTLPSCVSGGQIVLSFVLCDIDTSTYCFSFPVCATNSCASCEGSLDAVANCDSTLSENGNYFYTGSITFDTDLDFGFISPEGVCNNGGVSNMPFPHQGTLTKTGINNNSYLFEYTLYTQDPNFDSITALLCIQNGDNLDLPACIEVNITIGDRCPLPPPDRCDRWAPKRLDCTSADTSGSIIFNWVNSVVINSNYDTCSNGPQFSITSPASIAFNSISVSGSTLTFDADITVPLNYDQSQVFVFNLILCDGEGQALCLEMPLLLKCDVSQFNTNFQLGHDYFLRDYSEMIVVPNPANGEVRIYAESIKSDQFYEIDVFGYDGRKHDTNAEILPGNLFMNVDHLMPGVYMVRLRNDEKIIGTTRMVIVR